MGRTKTERDGTRGRRPVSDDLRKAVLTVSVDAMRWRLREAATRIDEAHEALFRHDPDRAHERLLDLEPLVFEVERVLSGVFVVVKDARWADPAGDPEVG